MSCSCRCYKHNINKSSRSFTKLYCISYLQTPAYHCHVCHINTVWLFVNYPPFHHRSLHHHPLHQPPKASNCACHTHRLCILHCVSTPPFGCQLSLGLCICFKGLSSSSLDCVHSLTVYGFMLSILDWEEPPFNLELWQMLVKSSDCISCCFQPLKSGLCHVTSGLCMFEI